MRLQTIDDWKKIIHKTGKDFDEGKWTMITGELMDSYHEDKRCFNGGIMCNIGIDLQEIADLGTYGLDDYLDEGNEVNVTVMGLRRIACSLCGGRLHPT